MVKTVSIIVGAVAVAVAAVITGKKILGNKEEPVMDFSPVEKKPVLSGEKIHTIRVGSETGIYEKGKEYPIVSKATGKSWGINARILSVEKIPLDKIPVPASSVKSFAKRRGISLKEIVEFITFETIPSTG